MTGSSSGVSKSLSTGSQGSIEQMNAQIQAIVNEQKVSGNHLIKSKFHDKQSGKEYNYTHKDGRIITKNGLRNVNFIVDDKGNLHIGKGHSYLANGKPVQAAGTLKLGHDGTPRRVTNLSGHYQPSVGEMIHYLGKMHDKGFINGNTWVDIYSFDKSKSGYITKVKSAYSGPYKYFKRRLSK